MRAAVGLCGGQMQMLKIGSPHIFTTDRLHLRKPNCDDAGRIFANYARDQKVTRFMIWRPHDTVGVTREFLLRCDEGWDSGAELTWVIERDPNEGAIGMVACRPDGHRVDVGYVLARSCWRKGYTTEAVATLVNWLSSEPTIQRVWATCDVENVASARVLEKVGMAREGILRAWEVRPNIGSEARDAYMYGLVVPSKT